MKPHPLAACLLRLSSCADLALYALHLAGRNRGPVTQAERLDEATRFQSERLFWRGCYLARMSTLQGLISRGESAESFTLHLPF